MSARLTAAAITAVGLLLIAAAPASAEPLRVAVWLRADSDDALLERVRGQVVDLDVELIAVRAGRPRPGRGRQAARGIGRDHAAPVVVWFRAGPGELSIYVADLAGERLLVRSVEPRGDDDLARSAALETAAVIVRSSLRAIVAGGAIGISEAAPPRAEPTVAAPATPPTRSPAVAAGAASRPFAGVGWTGAFTDADSSGHHGLSGSIGLARGRLRAAIDGAIGLPVDYADAMTTIRVSRSAVAARLGITIWRGAGAEVAASLAGGAIAFSRSTIDAGGLSATPPGRLWSPLVAPDLRLILRPAGVPVAFELAAGADLLLRVPSFGYRLDDRFVERNELWPVVPRIGLSVLVEGGR